MEIQKLLQKMPGNGKYYDAALMIANYADELGHKIETKEELFLDGKQCSLQKLVKNAFAWNGILRERTMNALLTCSYDQTRDVMRELSQLIEDCTVLDELEKDIYRECLYAKLDCFIKKALQMEA